MLKLTVPTIKVAAGGFLKALSRQGIPSLFGSTDGKAVGTYVEHEFHTHLQNVDGQAATLKVTLQQNAEHLEGLSDRLNELSENVQDNSTEICLLMM